MELRYEPGDEEEGSSIIAIIEEGRVGVEVYENGVEKYSQYRDITVEDAAHACEFFREIAEKASHDVGSTSSTRTVSQADDSFDDDEEDFAEDAEAEDDDEEGFEEDAEAESADAEADAEEEAESAEADAEPEPDPDSFEVEE
ncbi:hypothetical protein JW758_03140 [Candidatus Peregrinibacteria bacterium]|nr:hypothetical protein [Candidatus Peregrinibacteria bacterium]